MSFRLSRRSFPTLTAAAALLAIVHGATAQVSEIEPNDTKAAATPAPGLASGAFLSGTTTGSSTVTPGLASADYYLISTAAAPLAIYRHRLWLDSETIGHTGTIRGLTQASEGINFGTDATVQTSLSSTSPTRMVQWYGFGRQEQLYYRVTGATATTSNYTANLLSDTVTPVEAGTFVSGSITIARPPSITSNIDMWVYDAGFNAIADYGNDAPDTLTRNFTAGTYYLAYSATNLANDQRSATGDTLVTAAVLDFPNAVADSSSANLTSLPVRFTDAFGPVDVPAARTQPFEVVWFRFTVSDTPPATGSCCLPDGTCVTATSATCATQGGTYGNDGSLCANAQCPQPGACCFSSSFTCQVLSQAQCAAAGGNYLGASTVCGSCPAPPPGSVAILAATAAADISDAQSKLMGTGLIPMVVLFNTQTATPTLQFLQQFDSVLIWSNLSFQSGAAMGDVLADYVDSGGGVVNAMFSVGTTTANRFLAGRWNANYQIIPQLGGATTGAAGMGIGTILIPNHPILAGVNTFTGGTSNTRPTSTALTAHGVKVAQWVDGKTLIAVSSTQPHRVDLGMYPPSRPTNSTGWDATTDGARLMANALIYAGRTIAPPCGSADFDCDGDTGTDFDIQAFFACLGGACPAAPCTNSADFDGDGDTGTDFDIQAFFRVLGGGTC